MISFNSVRWNPFRLQPPSNASSGKYEFYRYNIQTLDSYPNHLPKTFALLKYRTSFDIFKPDSADRLETRRKIIAQPQPLHPQSVPVT